MEKENLDNGIKPDVGGNEALRVAVDFAEWIAKENYVKCIDGNWLRINDKKPIDFKKKSTIILYKLFRRSTAKATDR